MEWVSRWHFPTISLDNTTTSMKTVNVVTGNELIYICGPTLSDDKQIGQMLSLYLGALLFNVRALELAPAAKTPLSQSHMQAHKH